MLKRKDWQLFDGQDVSDQDSEEGSTDSEDEQPIASFSSSQELGDGDEGSEESLTDEGDLEGDLKRLEDLSEDDFEPQDTVDREAVAVKETWLAASKGSTSQLPKAALACRLCKGVLMLGPASLIQHLYSKKHVNRLKRKADDYEPVCLARDAQEKGDLETHQERLQRTKAVLAEKAMQKQPAKKRKKKSDTQSKEGVAKKRKGSKAGKRERAEALAERLKISGKPDTEGVAAKESKDAGTSGKMQNGGKRSLWSSPKPQIAGTTMGKGKSGSSKRKKDKKANAGAESRTANRAERRRVKRERLKSVPAPSKG